MKVKKIFKNVVVIILCIAAYIGFLFLIGQSWDRSPTTIYQKEISENRGK